MRFKLSKVHAAIGATPYAVAIEAGPHRLTADEPVKLGGGQPGRRRSTCCCRGLAPVPRRR